jgi:hypothetical protein
VKKKKKRKQQNLAFLKRHVHPSVFREFQRLSSSQLQQVVNEIDIPDILHTPHRRRSTRVPSDITRDAPIGPVPSGIVVHKIKDCDDSTLPTDFAYYDEVKGYTNHGNTCYFNSLVQLLVNIPELRDLDYLDWLKEPPTASIVTEWGGFEIGPQRCAFEAFNLTFWKQLEERMGGERWDEFKSIFYINIRKSYSISYTDRKKYYVLQSNRTLSTTTDPVLPLLLNASDTERSLAKILSDYFSLPDENDTIHRYNQTQQRHILHNDRMTPLKGEYELTTYYSIVPPLPKYLMIQIKPFLNTQNKYEFSKDLVMDECLQIDRTRYTCISLIVHGGSLTTVEFKRHGVLLSLGYRTGGHYVNYSVRKIGSDSRPTWYLLNDEIVERLGNYRAVIRHIRESGRCCVGALYVQNETRS